ncbi:MAG: guanylate kinase [Angelakisella sp.]
MNKPHGMLIVFSGPSGAGKGTILEEYFRRGNSAVYSISATTRKPRAGEVDGVHYHFVTREAFEKMIAEDEVVEYTTYNGNYYGSPTAPIRKLLAEGKDVVLEIEVKGAAQVRSRFPGALSIFVMPPTFEELSRRLVGRGTETDEEIKNRLATARKEVAMASQYDYIVVNDTVSDAADRLGYIIEAARCSQKFNKEFINEVLENA